jgi:hypothetical protein
MRAHTLSEPSEDPVKKFPAPMPAEKLSPNAAYAKFSGIRLDRGEASAFTERKIGRKSKERILTCKSRKRKEICAVNDVVFWEVMRIYTCRPR